MSDPIERQPAESRAARAARSFQPAAARRPLGLRKRAEREIARRRIIARTQRGLTPAQAAFDPLMRASASKARRRWRFVAAILLSLLGHVAAIVLGIASRSGIGGRPARQEVKIEMRARPPEPPPPKEPPPPPPEKPASAPKVTKAPPPPLPVPPPATPKPVRIVGLSLESTTEGGSGPSFAVGNTRQGETAEHAVAPKDIGPPPENTAAPTNSTGSGKGNQVASRIPVAGVKYEQPKRRHPKEPNYPATLKSQGIEGDVPVLVSIDTTGKVASVKILKPSPYPEFNEAARAAALAEDYDPATRDGVPMPMTISFTYRFRLEDQ